MFRKLFVRTPSTADDINDARELVRFAGHPELQFALITPSMLDIRRALEAWSWIGVDGLVPIAVSAFGDMFFVGQDCAILHLDWVEGKLNQVADSLKDFELALEDENARDDLLLSGLTIGARNRGLRLESNECYDFKIAPVLGGKIDGDNVVKLSFVVKLHIAGQIHEQVRNMPPGTKITELKITD